MDIKILGENLRELRKSYQLTQEQIGEIIGKNRSIVAKYETGKTMPPLNVLNALAKLYNVTFDELCGKTQSKKNKNSIVFSSDNNKKKDISFQSLSEKEKQLILSLRMIENNEIIDEILNNL